MGATAYSFCQSATTVVMSAAMPNGPLLMNRTRMLASALPVGSRNSNTTVVADWQNEYPVAPLGQAAAPQSGSVLAGRPTLLALASLAISAAAGCMHVL